MRWISKQIVFTYVQINACSRVITSSQSLRKVQKIQTFYHVHQLPASKWYSEAVRSNSHIHPVSLTFIYIASNHLFLAAQPNVHIFDLVETKLIIPKISNLQTVNHISRLPFISFYILIQGTWVIAFIQPQHERE